MASLSLTPRLSTSCHSRRTGRGWLTSAPISRSYHPSEIVLGNALSALAAEHPRESYKLISKCGRYNSEGFDYSPANIETSVRRSLKRLQTSYLDCVCAFARAEASRPVFGRPA